MREGNRLRAGLIAGTLALLPLPLAAAGTGSNLCAAPGGSPVVVNPDQTGSASGQSIPIAFNSQDGEFLVTWDINADGGQRGVYAQRVAADGSLVGDNGVILEGEAPEIFFTPAVAYSPADNHYFVASQFQGPSGSPDFNNGFGRLVTAAGEPTGDIVRLSPAGLEGTLVFNPVTEEFLHHARNFDGGGDNGIYFRRIDGDGTLPGDPTPIATTGNPAPAGDVEVNAATGDYLSTWRDQDAGALKGRLLDGDGAPLDEPFVISDVFPPFGFASSVAYDPIDDQYLVVSSGFTNPSPLFGQFVDAAGDLIGPLLTLVDGDIQLPRIAYDPIHEAYLITWVEAGGIWVQLLSRQGEELGEPQQLTSSVGFATSGWAVANENSGGFLVGWLQGDGTHVAVRLVDVIDECGVAVDPKTVDFGDQEVGTTSPPQTVMVENAGDTDLDLGTLTLAGDHPGDYAIVVDTCSEQLLTPGGTCTFDVTFTPAAPFTRVARVEIPSDAPVSPNTVDLRGNGLGAVVAVTPQAVDFGEIEVGQTSPPAAVTVENVGSDDLVIGDLALSGEESDAFGLVSDGCSGQTVADGDSCTFEVAFTPSALGTHTAAAEIPSNAPSSPDVVDLQGEGVPTSPDIQADPASLSSTLPEGGMETHDLTVSNLGDTTLEWEVTEAGGLTGGMPLAGGSRPRISPIRAPVEPAPWRAVADVAGSEATREGEAWSWTDPGMTVGDPAGAVSNVFPSVGSLTFYEARGDFQAANPGLPLEDFGDTNAPPNEVTSCSPPFNSDTDNACFSPGDIAPGLSMDVTIVDGEAGGDAVVLTPPFGGAPCVSVGPEQFFDHADWDFDPRVRAVGFDLQSNEAGQVFTVTVFGPGGALGSTEVTSAGVGSPVFFGVDTADTQGISRIEVRGPDQRGELFCDVEFGGEPVDCTLPDWVSVDPTSGSVVGGDSQLVGVTFDTTGLAPGDYAANLCLASNDPDTPTQPVPLTLTVEDSGGDAEYTPVALVVDPEIRSSDGNGIFEPGEQVDVAPWWRNDGEVTQNVMGTASDFGGPPGATYSIAAETADYGTFGPGQTAGCLDTGVCYALGLDDPAERPAPHWEATFEETLDDADGTAKTWILHIGGSFADVPATNPFYPAIETLLHSGITGGCTAGTDGRHGGRPLQAGGAAYCPGGANSRAQMPVFVLRALMGSDYTPPPCVEGDDPFGDVPFDSTFCPWIQDLADRGIVSGCGDGDYCPGNPVTRAQMAIFLLKTLEGADYDPPECSNQFTDVPCPSLFADWIEDLAAREITSGCSPTTYCPGSPVSRAQMAVFVSRTFGLTLYGP